jgi:hypothetical protein
VDDRRGGRARPLLDEPHVELEHLGRHERHQRERAAVGADVVEGDRAAQLAHPGHPGEHLGRPVGQRALRELQHHVERFVGPREQRRAPVGDRRVEQRRLDVDEQAGLQVGGEQQVRALSGDPSGPRASAS